MYEGNHVQSWNPSLFPIWPVSPSIPHIIISVHPYLMNLWEAALCSLSLVSWTVFIVVQWLSHVQLFVNTWTAIIFLKRSLIFPILLFFFFLFICIVDLRRPSYLSGFPDSSAGKESTCNAGDLGLIPGLGRSSGEGKGYPLQYSGPENPMDSPWGHKELDRVEWLSLSLSFFSLLAVLWNSAFSKVYPSLSPLLFTSLLSWAVWEAPSDSHFAFLHFSFFGMVSVTASCTMLQTSVHSSSGLCLPGLIPWIC